MPGLMVFERGGGTYMYSPLHIMWLASAAALCLWSALMARRHGRAACRAVGMTLMCAESARVLALYIGGKLSAAYLPLHLCSIAAYACMYHAARGGETIGELIYSSFAPGALSALLFPDWLGYPPTSILFLSSFGIHMLICAYCCAMLASGAHRPSARRLPRCLAVLLVYAAAVLCFDRAFGMNYLFLMAAPAGSPLEWLGEFFPWHAMAYIPLVAVVWCALYLPPVLVRMATDGCLAPRHMNDILSLR